MAPVAVRPLPASAAPQAAPSQQPAANGRTLARRPGSAAQPASKPVSAPPPTPTADLAAAAAAAGAEMQTGGDFLEIRSHPRPASPSRPAPWRPPVNIARTPATAEPGIFRDSAAAPRQLGGGSPLARATYGSSGSSGGSSGDAVVSAVLRAMREENEHLGILDGIDPLY